MAKTDSSFPTGYYKRLNRRVELWQVWVTAVLVTLGFAAILSLSFVQTNIVDVEKDLPSPERIESPQSKTFISTLATQKQQTAARAAVDDVYTELDRSIARTQLTQMGEVFNFVKAVRADSFATEAEKIAFLRGIEVIKVDEETAELLLAFSDQDLGGIQSRATNIITVLMRREIRDDAINDFSEAVEQELDFATSASQEKVLLSIVPQMIRPNSFYDEVATKQLEEQAVAAVEPVVIKVIKGDTILLEGERVTAEKIELLQELGLLQQQWDILEIIRVLLISAMSTALIFVYYTRYHLSSYPRRRYLAFLIVILLSFVAAGQLMMGRQQMLGFLFPAAALSMLVSVIYGSRLAGLISLVIGGMIGFAANGSLEIAFYIIAGSHFAIFSLRDAERINAFFRAGFFAALGNILVVAIFNLKADSDLFDLLQLVGLAVASGFLSAMLTLAWFYVAGTLFNITTMLQLQELSRFDQPLLQQLLQRAPGTYHHSIMVANLAEQAADRIGANSLLTRVGAFYHDIGKMVNPPYFSENQEGTNPHDTLDPYESARYIIGHVTDGLVMARKERLPERIQDFIAEHHGDNLLKWFYKKAHDAAAESGEVQLVSKEKFRYPGPAPRCRETGIVMLADVVEATSKAVQPNNVTAIEKLVRSITDDLIAENQLDNSGLTFQDLKHIRASFVETLKGRFHVRVKYAGNEELEAANTENITEGELTPAPSLLEPAVREAVSSD